MMIRKALIATAFTLVACGPAQVQEDSPFPAEAELPGPDQGVYPSMMRMSGDVIGADGEAIGTLNLLGGPNGVLIEVTIDPNGLAPGWHGLHLHQVGNCDDLGVFKLSGGHVGKVEGGHGLLNPKGPEGGDLPNIYAGPDGSAGYEAVSTLFTMADLAGGDGAALIIHEGRDDHMSQPIGGAGGRVACAVVG
ncbi:MAG: superoxide dismutase family protein [Henriciella sp.]|nr:superoxide dismutase family protein [Henriciella sp.]